jgi:hypothetical protein
MDWITLTHAEVQNDALAPACVHCGAPAAARHNQDFEWQPDWVNWLYLLGIVPGIVASALCKKTLRVSLPICEKHGPLSGKQTLVMVVGCLLAPAICAGLALGALLVINRLQGEPPVNYIAETGITAAAAIIGLVGFAAWQLRGHPVFRYLTVRAIDDNGITLVGLADPFVQAMREQRQAHAAANCHPSPSPLGILKHPEP